MKSLPYLFLIILLLFACSDKNPDTLFTLLDKEATGIDFSNTIFENDTINILTLEYVYNGGAVAVGDFNKDGLSDLYLGGNMVADKLYLNKGDFKFEDITTQAGIRPSEKWRSGVALADVNGDGWLDIYVCATISKDSTLRENMLYVNQGLDSKGLPTFKEEAKAYGIADNGYSSGAAFLDYDNDGDLDLFVLTNTIEKGVPTTYRPKIDDGSALNTDRLYRNNGNGTFSNVTREAGVIHEGYGLGLAIADINKDGWQDIYVSNDYIANDILYLNNKDGTFTNVIDRMIKHQSQFSMGNDIADINHDALPDIVTLDMLPEGNLRRKTVIGGPTYTGYINNKQYGYAHQYIRNMLQLNNGDGTFSEIGQMAGVHQTEWSWSPLFADFDNDGERDLMITNGFPRDITDKDFANFRNDPGGAVAGVRYLLDSIPVVKIPNYAFKNNGDLRFTDVTKEWGITMPSFSNGAAFADFDNDGDLDYVVNNISDPVSVYRNNLYSKKNENDTTRTHYLRVKLEGKQGNIAGLGTKLLLKSGGRQQYHDHSVYRGYISVVEDVVHFGTGDLTSIDTLYVRWPDGKAQLLRDVKTDQLLKISYTDAVDGAPDLLQAAEPTPLLQEVGKKRNVEFVHKEDDKIDFNLQRTLPHKFSQMGPGIAVGDVNGDEREDFIVGGSVKSPGSLFLQQKDGTFSEKPLYSEEVKKEEDESVLLFDADGDGDLDLYIVSGGIEYEPGSPNYQDRLYMNDGKGNFRIATDALPDMKVSEACVRAADFDGDGDLDLFTGSRIEPRSYPFGGESNILRNDKGKFTKVTDQVAPELETAGMVNDALWTDYDDDGKVDLMIAGEFAAITVYHNEGGKLVRQSATGLEKYSGWWNSLTGADFDGDGDTDYLAGNLGLNNYYRASDDRPLRIYAKDIDGNGSVDAIMSCYFRAEDGTYKEFPLHFWDELNGQSPKFRQKYEYYREFGRVTMNELFTPEEAEGMTKLEVNYTSSSYIENLGSGKFAVHALPVEAQFAPVNGMVTADVNEDGHIDAVLVGNDYGNEVFSGRYDAFNGLVLLGNGKGKFAAVRPNESGFRVPGDAKSLACLFSAAGDVFIASQNQDSLKMFGFGRERSQQLLVPKLLETKAELRWADGRVRKVELYYGSGYLSQSSRCVRIPPGVATVTLYDSKGNTRQVSPVVP